MNSKVVTVVLAVAILVSTFALQTEAFTMGAGGPAGKRQQVSCAEVVFLPQLQFIIFQLPNIGRYLGGTDLQCARTAIVKSKRVCNWFWNDPRSKINEYRQLYLCSVVLIKLYFAPFVQFIITKRQLSFERAQ